MLLVEGFLEQIFESEFGLGTDRGLNLLLDGALPLLLLLDFAFVEHLLL